MCGTDIPPGRERGYGAVEETTVLVAVLAVQAHADQCPSHDPFVDPRLDGAVGVPIDAGLPWDPGEGYDALGNVAATLYDADGAVVSASGRPLVPDAPLAAETEYRLELAGADLYTSAPTVVDEAWFTTGPGPAAEAGTPEVLEVEVGEVIERDPQTVWCGEPYGREVRVTVALVADDPLSVVEVHAEEGGPLLGQSLAAGDQQVALEAATGSEDDRVCLFAVLRNAAQAEAASETVCAGGPPVGCGCVGASGPASGPTLLAGLLAVRRRGGR